MVDDGPLEGIEQRLLGPGHHPLAVAERRRPHRRQDGCDLGRIEDERKGVGA